MRSTLLVLGLWIVPTLAASSTVAAQFDTEPTATNHASTNDANVQLDSENVRDSLHAEDVPCMHGRVESRLSRPPQDGDDLEQYWAVSGQAVHRYYTEQYGDESEESDSELEPTDGDAQEGRYLRRKRHYQHILAHHHTHGGTTWATVSQNIGAYYAKKYGSR